MDAFGVVSDLRVWTVGALALGLLIGETDIPSSELIIIALMIQMTLSLDGLRFSAEDIREGGREFLLSMLLCYGVNTAVTIGIGLLFAGNNPEIWHGWTLLASMPCAISVVTAAVLMKGNIKTAVSAVAATYAAGIVLTPLISFAMLGDAVNPLEILKYIVLFIAVPVIVSIPLRKLNLSRKLKIPFIDLMMGIMLFLSVSANREYLFSYPELAVAVVAAGAFRLLLLIGISRFLMGKLNVDSASKPVFHVLCVWKNTGLSVSMCMVLLANTPESVIPCFICMIMESLWFSMYTRRSASPAPQGA